MIITYFSCAYEAGAGHESYIYSVDERPVVLYNLTRGFATDFTHALPHPASGKTATASVPFAWENLEMIIGAHYLGNNNCEFVLWAPFSKLVELHILSPEDKILPMERCDKGYWKTIAGNVPPGTSYLYKIDETEEYPDPASHFQPEGVHGPSQVTDHNLFQWEDGAWKGIDLCSMIIYEIHVGTFTPEGTFGSVIPRLDDLKDLGINTLLIMPVAQCPGVRNWGYDGAYPFAVQNSYGGPDGMKRLVNECHKRNIAVKLDVVYNHLGPEGNYVSKFGPYYTDKYKTPWGQAMNFDGEYSDEVRNFFIQNANYWFLQYHIDVLRMDAADRIYDINAYPFLQELADEVRASAEQAGRKCFLIAEADQNDPKLIRPKGRGGFGLDAQWCDDFHHCIHALLTGEKEGYYIDFGSVGQLAKSFREGFVFSGEYSAYRKCRRGQPSTDIPGCRFVVFSQNHDQVGNRMAGGRLAGLVHFEALKLAAGAVFLSPFLPLLFMGEEYGEEAPFRYFVNHSDPGLIRAVREGRKSEFTSFAWEAEPPDPEGEETFLESKTDWEARKRGKHKTMLGFYKALISLRKGFPALSNCSKDKLSADALEEDRIIFLRRWENEQESRFFCILNFNIADTRSQVRHFLPDGKWKKVFDSSDTVWNGPGGLLPMELRPHEAFFIREHSFAVFQKEGENG